MPITSQDLPLEDKIHRTGDWLTRDIKKLNSAALNLQGQITNFVNTGATEPNSPAWPVLEAATAINRWEPVASIIIGDSRAADQGLEAPTNSLRHWGIVPATNWHCDERILVNNAAGNLGVGGETTTQIAARVASLATSVAAYSPVKDIIVFYIGGTNDIQVDTPAETINTRRRIVWDYVVKTLNLPLVIIQDWPRTTDNASRRAIVEAIRQDAIAYAATNSLTHLCDAYSLFTVDGIVQPQYLKDAVHLNAYGARTIGKDIAEKFIIPRWGKGVWYEKNWQDVLWNNTLKGTTGTNLMSSVTLTGNVPTDWVLRSSASGGGTRNMSITPLADGGIEVTCAALGGDSTEEFYIDSLEILAGAGYSTGELYKGVLDFEILEATNCNGVYIRLVNDLTSDENVYANFKSTTAGAYEPPSGGRRIVKTHPTRIPSSTPNDLTYRIAVDLDAATQPSVGGYVKFRVYRVGLWQYRVAPTVDGVITPAGTTGAVTIDRQAGTVNVAAGQNTVVVTNNLVTTNSIVFAVIRTNDTTATIKNVNLANGSFTIRLGAPATAETSIGFEVRNIETNSLAEKN